MESDFEKFSDMICKNAKCSPLFFMKGIKSKVLATTDRLKLWLIKTTSEVTENISGGGGIGEGSHTNRRELTTE